jgi:hypothetical protein
MRKRRIGKSREKENGQRRKKIKGERRPAGHAIPYSAISFA